MAYAPPARHLLRAKDLADLRYAEALAVDDLARPLGLTDNGIRAHLLSLERDGLVRQAGARRGERKPSSLYELAPSADRLFPRAYGQVLRELLEVLGTNLSGETLALVLRQTGRRLATEYATAAGTSPRTRPGHACSPQRPGAPTLMSSSAGHTLTSRAPARLRTSDAVKRYWPRPPRTSLRVLYGHDGRRRHGRS